MGVRGRMGRVPRRVWVVVPVVVVAVVAAFLLWPDADSDVVTEADDTTTTEFTSTTTAPATTSTMIATTTTTVPTTVAPTTMPLTTAPPPTAPPPTAPPATAPPSTGSFNVDAVLAFAQAHETGAPPQTYTGAKSCPAFVAPPRDGGDDTVRDIDQWYLSRYCDGVYRGVLSTADEGGQLKAAWFRFDTGAGGCQGTDRVVIGWWEPSGQSISGHGGVIKTPTCSPSSWSWVDRAGYPVFNGASIQLDFRGAAIGNPSSFTYHGYVQGVGDPVVDVVPNGSPGTFHL